MQLDKSELIPHIKKTGGGHWLWRTGNKFAVIKRQGVQMSMRRAVWITFRGPISGNLQLSTKCGVKFCLNPKHLQLLPQGTANMLTHCLRGHRRSGANIYYNKGIAYCRACHLYHQLRYLRRTGRIR